MTTTRKQRIAERAALPRFGGDDWDRVDCGFVPILRPSEEDIEQPFSLPASLTVKRRPPTAPAPPAPPRDEIYVPSARRREGGFAIKISNLSQEATERDLRALYASVGGVLRCTVVRDRETSVSKGYAFVNFATRSHAERAVQLTNGHGYDNMVLEVVLQKN